MTPRETVTVVIPTFNAESVIGDCLDSVAWADAVIVVDRDSADEPLPGQPEPVSGLAKFTASAGCGSIWVVVRDGRGGIGWIGASCTAP